VPAPTPGYKLAGKHVFIEKEIVDQYKDVKYEYIYMMQVQTGARHRFLCCSADAIKFDGKGHIAETPEASTLLIELLAQPQVVLWNQHHTENAPYELHHHDKVLKREIGGAGRLNQPFSLQGLLEDANEHWKESHTWNQIATGAIFSLPSGLCTCIEFAEDLWNRMEPVDIHSEKMARYWGGASGFFYTLGLKSDQPFEYSK